MKMKKTFLIVDELQDVCKKLNLETNGLKHELIERIINCTSSDSPSTSLDSPSTSSSIVARISQGTQTDESPIDGLNKSYNGKKISFKVLLFVVLLIGIFFTLFQLFMNKEIPKKRSFFC